MYDGLTSTYNPFDWFFNFLIMINERLDNSLHATHYFGNISYLFVFNSCVFVAGDLIFFLKIVTD